MTVLDELVPGDWMQSVARLLPLQHRAPFPVTLGEAVAELELWARTARAESWAHVRNKDSLDLDVKTRVAVVGPRLWVVISDLIPKLVTSADRSVIVEAAAEFANRWRQPATIEAAFRDLCEAAAEGSNATWELRPMAEILASQVVAADRGDRVLNETSNALVGNPHPFEIEDWLGEGKSADDLTPSVRLSIASKILTADADTGHVVVWLLYRRAQIRFRTTAGPMTFLLAEWAIPNASDDNGQEFAEREELRSLLEHHPGFNEDELLGEVAEGERYVLVRVDLGERSAVGAAEEAARRVDAVLSITVEAGGVSWIDTGTSATLFDGRERMSSYGAIKGRKGAEFGDSYGMNGTGQLLDTWAGRLNTVLSNGPMPDFLVEALNAVREASMIEHRDVLFYNARPVAPRVAVALQDHAIELVASLAEMTPDELTSALEEDEVDHEAEQLVLNALLLPLDRGRQSTETVKEADALEREVSRFADDGTRLVSVEKVWDQRDRLRALPTMAPAERITLERGLVAISSAPDEAAVRERARESVAVVRARHRRVRNAIAHGNPVASIAIDSVRRFSERIARAALAVALYAYATGDSIPDILAERRAMRDEMRKAMDAGTSEVERILVMRDASALTASPED